MNFQLTCRHCEVSEALREYVTRKTERFLKRFDGIHNVEMVLTLEGGKSKAELIVGVVRGRRCVAEVLHEDMFAAVDLVVDKMDGQVRKLKGKLRDRHGKVTEPPTTPTP